MCGIAGFLRRDGAPASAADAARMALAMPHRGPDGHGAFADGPVALGHVRLAVRDRTERSAQPLAAPGGEGVLVYNGEVYGEASLRADLAREGVVVDGPGDAPVVLHALARWGPERALPRFDGMFALAWWDARERALWLARDRFGTKPLHVAVTGTAVAFASELRGLRALDGLARRPDLHEIARRIHPWPVDERRPPFEGVENVGPGEAWKVTAAGVERRVFADLLDVDVDRVLAAAAEPSAGWEARASSVVEAAVEAHLASEVPLAAFTSSGVDSNLVAAFARRRRPDLVAYTVDTDSAASEADEAEAVARHLGIEHRRVVVRREDYLRGWPAAVEAMEHPTCHGSHVASMILARRAREDGVVVALTGEGADELFGGYDFVVRTWKAWRSARRPWRRLTHAGRRAARHLHHVPLRYQSVRAEPDAHLRLSVALAPDEETRPLRLLQRLAAIEPAEDRAFLAHCLDALRRHLGWILLRHDRLCMASSVEARVPFLSNPVADFALHLPMRAKVRRGVGKWVLKRVAARHLPARVVWKRKQGFPVPGGHHAGTSAILRGGALGELLRWTRAAEEGLVPRVEASPMLRAHLVSLELWARLFVRGEPAEPLAERLLALPRRGRA